MARKTLAPCRIRCRTLDAAERAQDSSNESLLRRAPADRDRSAATRGDGSKMNQEEFHSINERAWSSVARSKYAHDVDTDIAFLSAGGTSLVSHERRLLGDLSSWCRRAIHLQCSHGLDILSLWNLGAREVIGVDISASMLDLAARKSQRSEEHTSELQSPC